MLVKLYYYWFFCVLSAGQIWMFSLIMEKGNKINFVIHILDILIKLRLLHMQSCEETIISRFHISAESPFDVNWVHELITRIDKFFLYRSVFFGKHVSCRGMQFGLLLVEMVHLYIFIWGNYEFAIKTNNYTIKCN